MVRSSNRADHAERFEFEFEDDRRKSIDHVKIEQGVLGRLGFSDGLSKTCDVVEWKSLAMFRHLAVQLRSRPIGSLLSERILFLSSCVIIQVRLTRAAPAARNGAKAFRIVSRNASLNRPIGVWLWSR